MSYLDELKQLLNIAKRSNMFFDDKPMLIPKSESMAVKIIIERIEHWVDTKLNQQTEWQLIKTMCQFELDAITIVHPNPDATIPEEYYAVEFCGSSTLEQPMTFQGETYYHALYKAYQHYKANEPRHR